MSSPEPEQATSVQPERRATPRPVTGRIVITGGTGFVGSNVRAALAGRPLRLIVRDPATARHLASDTVEIVAGDVTKPETLRGAFVGCEAVVHLVGIIEEAAGDGFDAVIHQGTRNVLAEAERAGVQRFIHMSALGAQDDATYPYLYAKWQSEAAVRQTAIPWTILRPSIIFGPGDGFINQLASLVRAPLTPVPGSGTSWFMPVAVEEVATIFATALDRPATAFQIYELGGGKQYSLNELLDVIGRALGRHHPRVHVPVPLIDLVVRLSTPLPERLRPPVTREQLHMLGVDNVTEKSATGTLLGRPALALEDGLQYLQPGARNTPPE